MRKLIFCLLSLAIASPVHAGNWWVVETDHFVVQSEGEEAEVKEFGERLERYDMAMRFMQNMPADPGIANTRLTIYRFGEPSDIASVAGASGSGIAGFFIPRASGPVAFVPLRKERERGSVGTRSGTEHQLTGEGVLFHEYAHYFMMNYFAAAYPSWYVEGFAEVYGATELLDDGAFRIGGVAKHRGAELLWLPSYPMTKLFAPEKDKKGEDRYRNYSVGWLMTHYLTFDKSRQGQLKKYLDAMNQGKTSMDAATAAFGDLNQLGRDLRKYMNSRLMGMEVKPASFTPPKVTVREMTEAEQAIFRVRARSQAGVTKSAAKGVAADARQVAANYPNDVYVQTALAEAELDADNLDAADAAVNRALAVNPDALDALIFKGRIAMKRAEKDPAFFAQARTSFVKAYKVNGNDPEALILNYQTYDKAGGTIPESAIIGLERAYQFAPYDSDVRLLLTRQLLREGKSKSARIVIVPLAFAPHASKPQQAAEKIVEAIDANKTAEALAAADKQLNEDDKKKD